MKQNAHVYVFERPGAVKVGHSVDPPQRAKAVGSNVRIAHTRYLFEAERVERAAHTLLRVAGKHIEGEWFSATVEEAVEAIEAAARMVDERPGLVVNRFNGTLHIKTDDEFDEMMKAVRASRDPIPSQAGLLRDLLREEWERTRKQGQRKRA